MRLEGLVIRGPVQSRPEWARECAVADAASRAAWQAYADALLGSMGDEPSITANSDTGVQPALFG